MSARYLAFVLQDDILFAHLTVRETLTYTVRRARIHIVRADEPPDLIPGHSPNRPPKPNHLP